ncbi:hypothetical protein LV779_20820 [Streptomyces thinghirensis]|nr:hypothetical protein [Streptomyces thinghirensis]
MHAITIPEPGEPRGAGLGRGPRPGARRGRGPGRGGGQRRQPRRHHAAPGLLRPPPGASPLPRPGVLRGASPHFGTGVSGWSVGDEVCALLGGGGYAEKVAVPAGQLLPVPEGIDVRRAAALPRWSAPSGRTSSWSPTCAPARRCSCTAVPAASAPWRSSSPGPSARRSP